MTNRLASSTSPYLLQHAENPVDWWPWSDAALAEARRRDVPILLSVGYAACHWCHVMAHESFEDAGIAALINENFVAVKVDREERPDIDSVYMEATVGLTGQGGWPMTCLLTPAGETFFAGTYFPKQHFARTLDSIARAWRDDREGVLNAGRQITEAIAAAAKDDEPPGLPTAEDLESAAAMLAAQFDRNAGGFGNAPKFPPSMVLEFMLRHYERTGNSGALHIVERTLTAMARGGIYDQLAGGFARYSVDARWVVPHFEKMLYDNAQLLRVYLHWWRLTESELALRIVRETADFMIRDLGTAQGGFASALDADSAGVEGLTYVWTPAQLADVLGSDRGAKAADLFAVTPSGTFEAGASTLQLLRDPGEFGITAAQFEDIRGLLLAVRSTRPQPGRDDKVVAAWNGLAIAALAEVGALLDEPRYLAAATAAAELIVGTHLVEGTLVGDGAPAGRLPRLHRTSRDGHVGGALGVAEDYGDVAEGLLALHQATAEARWLREAGELLNFALEHFRDAGGGFFDTGDDAEQLVRRPRDPADNAHPSGSTALVHALLTYSALTGSPEHRAAAEQALAAIAGIGKDHPRFLGWGLAAAEAMLAGPVQVAISGEAPNGPLAAAALRGRPPGAVVVSGAPDADGVPLLAGRPLVGGEPAAYVCRGMVCDLPVRTVPDLLSQLARPR